MGGDFRTSPVARRSWVLAQVWSKVGRILTFLEEELARRGSFLLPLPHELLQVPVTD